jgi:glutathione S-transferase
VNAASEVEANSLKVLTGSFIIRAYLLPKHGLLPENLLSDLAAKAPNFDKWANEVVKHPSVGGGIWDEEKIAANIRRRVAG